MHALYDPSRMCCCLWPYGANRCLIVLLLLIQMVLLLLHTLQFLLCF
jgi:hypothetical protein